MSGRTEVLEWHPLCRNSLRGFCRIRFPSGIEIADIPIHQGRIANMGRATRQADDRSRRRGSARRGRQDQIRRDRRLQTHGMRSRWSHAVIAALRDAHPDALDPEPPA
jgi:hypothetical protein